MATSAVQLTGYGSGGQLRMWDIFATADADTTLAITHGIPMASATDPTLSVRTVLEPRGAKFYTQLWIVTSVTLTTLTLTKTSVVAATGDAASQCRVFFEYLSGLYS